MLALSACQTTFQHSEQATKPPVAEQLSSVDRLVNTPVSEALLDPDLPKQALDEQILGEVLIANLAAYRGDWPLAIKHALDLALANPDYRLARLATLLALRNNDYLNASTAATRWVQLQGDNQQARNVQVLSQVGANQTNAAIQTMHNYYDHLQIDEFIRVFAGLLVRQRNASAALAIANHYVAAHPQSSQVYVSSAFVAQAFQRPQQAMQWIERALQISPDSDTAAQIKAGLLASQGKQTQRAEYISNYVIQHPKTLGMRINHAAELTRQQRYDDALKVMQAVLKDAPNDLSSLRYAAALAEQLEQTRLAKRYLSKALRNAPDDDEVRWSLARIAVNQQDYPRAAQLFSEISRADYFFQAQLQLANVQFYTHDLDYALNTLGLLTSDTEAQFVDIALMRQTLLVRAHDYQRALGAINEAIVYLPKELELRYARALIAVELRQIVIAEADFRMVVAANPQHANALNAFGYALTEQTNRYDEARQFIEQALSLRPNDAHILDSMGWVIYRQNDLSTAVDFLSQAYAKSEQVEIAAHLGEVLWELGQHNKAKEIWLKSFRKDGQHPVLHETLQRYGVRFD